MIRRFGHSISPALLGLLGVEILLLFGSFLLGRVLWRTWSGGGGDPDWAAILPSALALVIWLFPILTFTRRWNTVRPVACRNPRRASSTPTPAKPSARLGSPRLKVVGIGEQATRLENLYRSEALSCQILGYVQVQEDESAGVSLGRRLQVVGRLADLAAALRADEIVVALDDQRRGFPFDELWECQLTGIAIRPVLAFVERETGQIALDVLRPSRFLSAEGFPALFGRLPLKRGLDLVASLGLLALTWPVMLLAALAIGLESRFWEPILYRQIRVGQHDRPFLLDAQMAGQVTGVADFHPVGEHHHPDRGADEVITVNQGVNSCNTISGISRMPGTGFWLNHGVARQGHPHEGSISDAPSGGGLGLAYIRFIQYA